MSTMKTYDDPKHAAGCRDCGEDCDGETENLLACLKWRIEDVEQDLAALRARKYPHVSRPPSKAMVEEFRALGIDGYGPGTPPEAPDG